MDRAEPTYHPARIRSLQIVTHSLLDTRDVDLKSLPRNRSPFVAKVYEIVSHSLLGHVKSFPISC
jgi:hypothetical protein